jgi:PAS domain S-box-containing protein
VAILDDAGIVVAVNAPWREFAQANGGVLTACGVGADYLAVCRRGAGEQVPGAGESLEAIEALLAGGRTRGKVLYPCHAPDVPRWFVMRASAFVVDARRHVLVAHETATSDEWSRETYAKLSLIASRTSNGVILTNDRGRIEWVNDAYVRMTHFGCEEVVGRHVIDVLRGAGSDAPALDAARRALTAAQSVAITLRVHRRDRGALWVDLRLDPVSDGEHGTQHFVAILVDISERRRLEREVTDAAQRERERIARDLHDGLGQEITGAQLLLTAAAAQLERGSGALDHVHKALAALQRSFAEVRHLAQGMAPVQLSRGLGPALAALTTSLSMPGKLTLRYQGRDVPAMPNEVAEQLYRIAQEAVSNGIRHGAAARIDITLAGVPPGLELRVADDGGGIHAKQGAAGSGIRIMRYRADLILGHLDIGPGPAGGTQVRCVVPL